MGFKIKGLWTFGVYGELRWELGRASGEFEEDSRRLYGGFDEGLKRVRAGFEEVAWRF